MTIIFSKNGKNAKKIESSLIDGEDYLQNYVLENPEIIPVSDIDVETRLLVLTREFPTPSGPIDAIGIDQFGQVYIIETKLYKNPDKRRVVAQVLDYGAALWKDYDLDRFQIDLANQISKYSNESLTEMIQKFFDIGEDETNVIIDSMSKHIENGIFRFVVLMDRLQKRLKDLILYAGGLSENAFQKSIKLTRIIDDKYKIVDVNSDQFEFFQPKAGDQYVVDRVIEKYNNRVIIKGSVYRPGTFSISEEGMTIKDLINKAEGLKSDVFLNKAYITRTNSDYSTTNIPLNLKQELKNPEFKLQEEDVVNILSINDLSEENYVEISGEVNNPGIFPYSKNLTLSDMILLAGGFSDNATGKRVEINRRISNQVSNDDKISEILTVDLNKDLDGLSNSNIFKINPFDQIIIRKNPNFYVQQYARVEGEIMYPGKYAISSKSERISDLLKRAGGLKNFAYKKGATLIRLTEFAEIQSNFDKKIKSLNDLKNKVSNKEGVLTESEILLIQRIDEDLKNLDYQKNDNKNLGSYAKTERINEIVKRNSIGGDIPISKSEAIGIDLESIVESPGSKSDLLLNEGDVIIVPKKLETVRLRGELLYPTTVRFLQGKSLKYYINSSGGFDIKAKRTGTYIVYANGDVARTKKFLFFNVYPKAEPGSEVIVPKKASKSPIAANQLLSFTTGLAALILAITQIN
ncbi:MAG: hypothetical protein HOK38_07125 [Flavobacteriaceae bacterium]|nr:hypothetical protein [Flavobacteriaceae bacterium]